MGGIKLGLAFCHKREFGLHVLGSGEPAMVIKLGNAVIRSALHRVPDSGAGGALDQPLDASSLVPGIWPKLLLSPNY